MVYAKGEKLNAAIRILIDCLSEGEKPSEVMYRIARECGVSGRTLERAKRITGVESKRGKNNERVWVISDTVREKYSLANAVQPELPVIYKNLRIEPEAAEMKEINIAGEEKRFEISELKRIFLICKPVGFQGKYDHFAGLVPSGLANDVMKGDVFVFCGRPKRQISVLQWQGGDCALFFKRAEYVSFGWPVNAKAAAIEITPEDFIILLEYPRLMLRLSGVSAPFAVI